MASIRLSPLTAPSPPGVGTKPVGMRKITNTEEAMVTGYLDSIHSRGHLDLGQLKPFCQKNRLQGSAPAPSALIFVCIESFLLRTFSHIL
jgi:hypothetical protein